MKKIDTTLRFKDEREKFEFFLLAALYGIVFFNFLVWTNLSGDIFPKPDFHLFMLSWSTCPAFGLISAFFLRRYREEAFPEDRLFLSRMICMNAIGVLLLLQPMINWHPILRNGWLMLLSFVLLQGLGVGLSKFLGRKMGSRISGDDPFFLYRSVLVFFVVWLLALHSLTRIIRDWTISNYLFFAAVVFLFYRIISFGLKKNGEESSWKIGGLRINRSPVLYAAVFLLIAFLILDPHFRYQWYHGSYYLGPLADLMAGKSLMVDINAQYGILVFYFLKLFFYFLPVGFTSLSFLITILIITQYCLFYFILRQLFRSEIYSFFFLLVLILVNHFASVGWATVVPSVGPLRFGFIYTLMALVILRNQHPAKTKPILILESAVVAGAFFWSFEVCLYTVPAYLVFLFYENSGFEKDLQTDFRGLFRRLALLGALIFLIGAGIYLDVFLKSGQFPHVSYYLQYVFLYQGGFGMMQRPGLDYWCLVIGTLYFSLWIILALSLGRKKMNPLPEHLNVMALLTFYGILQYMYFIYRSHWNNLFHISMPSLLLFAYWFNLLRSSNPVVIPSSVKKFVFGLCVFFIGVYTQTLFPAAAVKIKDQQMPLPQMWERVKEAAKDIPREDGFARKAEALMRKYSGDKKVLPYFFSSNGDIGYEYRDYGLEVALYTGRVKNFPYNDVSQTCISKKTVARVLSFDPKLKPGDYVYTRPAVRTEVRNVLSDNVSFEDRLVDSLFSRYVLNLIEESDGIAVYQVKSVR